MSDSAAAVAPPATAHSPRFSDFSDADLFEWMALAGACVAKSHAAFAEFHRRHAAYLFAVCERRYRAEAEEIVAETLRRVYTSSSAQFDRSALSNTVKPDAARQLVRAWVGQIVRWVAADHFAARKSHPPTVTLDRIACACESVRTTTEVEELVTQVRNVIESLSAREQEIAWIIAHGWSPEHGQIRWSDDDLNAIADRFGLTRENIRQIRTRLIRKLRTRLEPILNSKPSASE